MTERPSVFEFGPFRVDSRRRLVFRSGELMDVPPRAIELLAVLLEEAGEVVTKEELLRRVWPDTFVEEANLSVNVSILRKALGQPDEGESLIQTVARRGYRFVGRVRAETAAVPRTLAVLPFRPMAAAEVDEPLAVGMADALITRLSETGRVVVRPTSAVRRFTGSDLDPLQAGQRLRVDAVLDARYQQAGGRLLVSAQLLAVSGESPLWAERFDLPQQELFALEDAIAERLAAALVVELTGEERRRLGRRHTDNVEAWQAYARGRYCWTRFSRPWIEKATASFEQAARLDPAYALPHAGMADVSLVVGLSGAVPPGRAWARAEQAVEQAREREPDLPEAQLASGFLRLFRDWDWPAAEGHLLRAVELSPLSAPAHQWHGLLLGLMGRFEEGHRALSRATEVDPLSTIASGLVGLLLAFEGRYQEEVAQQRRTVELDPQQFLGHWALGGALLNVGAYEEAADELRGALRLGEGTAFLEAFLARALAMAGERQQARALLKRTPRALAYQRAAALVALGEPAKALQALREACAAREAWVVAMHLDPAFLPLRSEPAFTALVERVGGGAAGAPRR